MPFADARAIAVVLVLAMAPGLGLVSSLAADAAQTVASMPVHLQRYCLGTMIEIVVYHPSRVEAERAAERAMQEIERLDRVLSHFKADSDLSRLNREGRHGFVSVDPSLYEVIEASVSFTRRSGGRFDVTIAPLLKVWQEAAASGRGPSDEALAAAKRCVGSDQIEMVAPNRIRLRSDCLAIDLGGIGKGYAVDRAIAVLKSAGIRSALINTGGSSMAAIGAPPGQDGWPVQLGAAVSARAAGAAAGRTGDVLLLRDSALSTSQQRLMPLTAASGDGDAGVGDILDPRSGAPIQQDVAVTVVLASGTDADALSTTLLLLSIEEARALLDQFPDVSALWIDPEGELKAAYHESRLQLQHRRPSDARPTALTRRPSTSR